MDILLTHGYFLYEDPKELQIMKPYPPLGILYICSHLRKKGLHAEVFDSTFSSRQELWNLLQQGPPSILGVYANLMTRSKVVEILRVAKESGWKTIVGGPEPGAYVQEYLAAGADVVVIGEGEITLEELVPALQSGASDNLHQIEGIAFLAPDGSPVRTKPRAQIKDIDAQPWPARECIDMGRYVDVWRQHHGKGSVSLITARGCPYHCRWCSHEVFGKTHRRRRPASVADELEWLIQRYQPQMAWMADDVFTIHHGWLYQYAAELRLRGLKLPFECISRADRLNPEVVETLAEMGCFRVWIGSESGSQRILDVMERGVTVEQVQTAVALCRSAGIQTGMFLMWGYEGEELSDIEATVDHVKKTDPDIFFTTVAYPIKGTPYFSEVAERVENLKSWATGSDREVGIRGRHSRQFYGFADRLLGTEVELERLRNKNMPDLASVAELQARIAEARAGLYNTSTEHEI
jgi:anaerobic magnesium-protoporphyrin IX monomethyl ester cyclase